MATMATVNRNNISQLLNRAVATKKSAKLSQGKFISSIDKTGIINAKEEFIKLPCQTIRADKLFDEMAQHRLPDVLHQKHPGREGEAIKNMLGLICEDAQPEDIPKFEKVFSEFAEADSKFTVDAKVSSELTFLFQKYGEAALNKQIDEYTEICRDAWKEHHNKRHEFVSDELIFTKDVMTCYANLDYLIKTFSQPGQTWTTVICNGMFFKDACTAISKTLQYHGASPDKSPLGNVPQNNSSLPPGLLQTDGAHPGITLPAGNGHGPITINNTANGGHGTSTVNGNVPERTPASDIDFGIALLNTPDEQLGNDKARLVDKFMDLHFTRARNGGQDKFSDHVDSVVQNNPDLIIPIETQSSPQVSHGIEKFVSMPAPQVASVNDCLPQPVMGQAETTVAAQKIVLPKKNVNLIPDELSAASVSSDTGKILQQAATQVAQALSALLTDADASVNSQNASQNQLPASTAELSSNPEQGLQSALTGKANSIESVGHTNNPVQQLVRKFEALNTQYLARNESTSHRMSPGLADRMNDTSSSRVLKADKTGTQPFMRASNKFKFDTSANQAPVYTTNRTIDPFSRHSVHNYQANVFDRKSEEELDNLELNSGTVSSL